jgi:hypothetical protein
MALVLGLGRGVAPPLRRWRQDGDRQHDLVRAVGPRQHFGQALVAFLAVDGGTDELSAPIRNGGPLLAAADLQLAGQHVVLAVAQERSQGAILEAAAVRAGLAEGAGLRIRQSALYQEARALQALQGGHGVVAAEASGEGVGQAARDQVHLTRAAAHGAGRDDLDADGQRARLQRGHQLAERGAFPFENPIGGSCSHGSDSALS